MGLINYLARRVAGRIDPQYLQERTGVMVGDEVRRQIAVATNGRLDSLVQEHLASPDFQERHRAVVEGRIQQLLPQGSPVLILRNEEFQKYKAENPHLVGPMDTITGVHGGYNSPTGSEDSLLEILKKKALTQGGNILHVKALSHSQNWDGYSSYPSLWFSVSAIADLYLNRELFPTTKKE